MNDEASLQTSFWVMIALQTIGSIDMPGYGARKMPSPRNYVAIIVAWLILQVVASAGAVRAAAVTGWTLVVTGMVVGPFGQRLISFLGTVATQFTTNPAVQSARDAAAQAADVPTSQVSGLTSSPPPGVTLGG